MDTDAKPVRPIGGLASRTIVKWVALYGLVAWPPDISTAPEVDQLIGGTKPSAFDADVAALEQVIAELTSRKGFFDGRRHPIFGAMSESAWMRWAYLHVDHHLRQFGA